MPDHLPVPPDRDQPERARIVQLGLSARTLTRYVAKGWVEPDLRLPSGQYRWDVERLRQQINAIPSEADDD